MEQTKPRRLDRARSAAKIALGNGAYQETLLDTLIRQRDSASAAGEEEAATELSGQIRSLLAPPEIGRTYRIFLASSHHRSYANTALDAHRSLPGDRQSEVSTFALVHADSSDSSDSQDLAGQWELEALDNFEQYGGFDEQFRSKAFRLKLRTGHFGHPRGGYLCGTPIVSIDSLGPKESKAAKRSSDSTWVVVQPLWACTPPTVSTWTLEPVDGGLGADGLWHIRLLVGVGSGGSRAEKDGPPAQSHYLEVHRSRPADARNPFSSYVHLHAEIAGHIGEWRFEEVYDPTAAREGAQTLREKAAAVAVEERENGGFFRRARQEEPGSPRLEWVQSSLQAATPVVKKVGNAVGTFISKEIARLTGSPGEGDGAPSVSPAAYEGSPRPPRHHPVSAVITCKVLVASSAFAGNNASSDEAMAMQEDGFDVQCDPQHPVCFI